MLKVQVQRHLEKVNLNFSCFQIQEVEYFVRNRRVHHFLMGLKAMLHSQTALM